MICYTWLYLLFSEMIFDMQFECVDLCFLLQSCQDTSGALLDRPEYAQAVPNDPGAAEQPLFPNTSLGMWGCPWLEVLISFSCMDSHPVIACMLGYDVAGVFYMFSCCRVARVNMRAQPPLLRKGPPEKTQFPTISQTSNPYQVLPSFLMILGKKIDSACNAKARTFHAWDCSLRCVNSYPCMMLSVYMHACN